MMDISLKYIDKKPFFKIADIILLIIADVYSLCYVLYLNQNSSPNIANWLSILLLMAVFSLVILAASKALNFETVAGMLGCHTPKEDLTFYKHTMIAAITAFIDTTVTISVLYSQFYILNWLYRL